MMDTIGDRDDAPEETPALSLSPRVKKIVEENEDSFGTSGAPGRMAIENIESPLLEERIEALREELTECQFQLEGAVDARDDDAARQAQADANAITASIAHLETVLQEVIAFEMTL